MVQTPDALQTWAESLTPIFVPAFAARILPVTWPTCLAARASLSDAILRKAVVLSRMYRRYAQTVHLIDLFSTSLSDTMASGSEMVRPTIVNFLLIFKAKFQVQYNK